jgi:outer membrane immunogenic protein
MTFRRFCRHLPDATFAVVAMACGFGVATAPAIAAPKRPAPPVLTDWGGWYGGVYLGGGFGSNPWSNPDDGDLGTTNLSGIIAGLQGGYNWQNGNYVSGLEVSAGLSTVQGDFEKFGWNFAGKVQGLESVTGRFGLATGTAGNTLLFVKGGVALGQYKFTSDWPEIDTHFETNKTVTGWTLGGGVEYRVAANWSLKAEFDYYNVGSGTVNLTPNTDFTSTYPVHIDNWSVSSFSAGFNYRFGGPR